MYIVFLIDKIKYINGNFNTSRRLYNMLLFSGGRYETKTEFYHVKKSKSGNFLFKS